MQCGGLLAVQFYVVGALVCHVLESRHSRLQPAFLFWLARLSGHVSSPPSFALRTRAGFVKYALRHGYDSRPGFGPLSPDPKMPEAVIYVRPSD